MILAGDHKPLVNYDALGPDAALSIPTPDHYLPLLYVLATRQALMEAQSQCCRCKSANGAARSSTQWWQASRPRYARALNNGTVSGSEYDLLFPVDLADQLEDQCDFWRPVAPAIAHDDR
jgi:hypothetical protein